MSISLIVTEEDLITLDKVAKREKNRIGDKTRNRILKRTNFRKMPEFFFNFLPITKKISETTEVVAELSSSEPKTKHRRNQL